MLKNKVVILLGCLVLTACASTVGSSDTGISASAAEKLSTVIANRSDEDKARDGSRHPEEALVFFGIEPGMAVAEVLPGGGWYTRVLAPYIGKEGAIYGLNYADEMWPMFGFFPPRAVKAQIASSADYPKKVAEIVGDGMTSEGFAFGRIPDGLKGQLDAVIMIRALHNLNRFEKAAGMRSKALADINTLLKPGGIVAFIQHRAPASSPDDWADGTNGYLKVDAVVAMFDEAGFELVASSEMNANLKDQPKVGDIVWRLPPSFRGAKTAEAKAAMMAIGESDRMTLKFRKK
jgi:predicted methyltransferase